MSFEIKLEDIKSIDHDLDFWSKRDKEMKKESDMLTTLKTNIENNKVNVKINKLKCIKQSKKKTKFVSKIEKEYEIVN